MARGDAEFAGERFQARLFQSARFDARISGGGETRRRVDRREPWCAFGPAEKARPEAGGLGGGGGRPEGAVLALGRTRGANAAAIDAGGFHAHIEASVKAPIFGDAGRVAGIGVQVHERNMGASEADVSP